MPEHRQSDPVFAANPGLASLSDDFAFVGVGLLLVDGTWRTTWHNPSAVELLGPALVSSLAARPIWEALEGAEALLRRLDDPETVRGNASVVGVAVRRDDRRVYVDAFVSACARAGARAYAITLVDVTMRVAAESEMARLRAKLAESERARQKLTRLQEELAEQETGQGMIGGSSSLARVKEQVARVAGANTTVLIHGETGSGKELVARSVHQSSPRRGQGFVAVNCAALPDTLIESELFGYERGAFTGADKRRIGKFELADGGTLFLDEIAELPLAAQAKLLRVLQENQFERVGGNEPVRVNVRVVAATHRDLARQVERGRFREDLFYRLNVFRIDVPPLRDRKEDLRELIDYLHQRVARRMARPVLPVSERSMRRVMAYSWPGNVRELANAVERATIQADGPELEIELPESPLTEAPSGGARGDGGEPPQTTDILLELSLEQLQRLQIMHALERCDYRVFGEEGAAVRLDINPRTLLSRMDKYGIPRPRASNAQRRGGGA